MRRYFKEGILSLQVETKGSRVDQEGKMLACNCTRKQGGANFFGQGLETSATADLRSGLPQGREGG